jgi:hypothetical protein
MAAIKTTKQVGIRARIFLDPPSHDADVLRRSSLAASLIKFEMHKAYNLPHLDLVLGLACLYALCSLGLQSESAWSHHQKVELTHMQKLLIFVWKEVCLEVKCSASQAWHSRMRFMVPGVDLELFGNVSVDLIQVSSVRQTMCRASSQNKLCVYRNIASTSCFILLRDDGPSGHKTLGFPAASDLSRPGRLTATVCA